MRRFIANNKIGEIFKMSIDKLQDQINTLQDEREELEEKCDTLDICKDDDGCSNCDIYKKIEAIDDKIEKLEEKIEDLMGEDEDFDDED